MPSDLCLPERPPVAAVEPILLDAQSAADLLAVSLRTLSALTTRGLVPSVLLGGRRLYVIATLREWAAGGCPPVSPELIEHAPAEEE
jgi:hypothetical protein